MLLDPERVQRSPRRLAKRYDRRLARREHQMLVDEALLESPRPGDTIFEAEDLDQVVQQILDADTGFNTLAWAIDQAGQPLIPQVPRTTVPEPAYHDLFDDPHEADRPYESSYEEE